MNEKSTSSLEREAERVRADIADTADHLKAKMSPGQLMDEAIGYFKDGDTNQLVANLKHQVRDNPLALALVGGGLAWLMMGSGPSHSASGNRGSVNRSQPGSPARSAAVGAAAGPHMDRPYSRAAAGAVASGISGDAAGAKDTASSVAHRVGDAASSATATAGDAVAAAADGINRSLHDLGEGVGEQVGNVFDASADMGERLKSSFIETLEREPLVIGALGLAVGAAIGAMVPVTRTEQQALGETGQRIGKEAKSAVSAGVDAARNIASEAYGAAREEADRQGLTRDDKPVAEKVAQVATAAGAKAKQGVHRAVDEAERKVEEKTDAYRPTRRN